MTRVRPDGACDFVRETFSAVLFCSSKGACDATAACRRCSGPWAALDGACLCTGSCETFPFRPSPEATDAWRAYVRGGAWFPCVALAVAAVMTAEWINRRSRVRQSRRTRSCVLLFTVYLWTRETTILVDTVCNAFGLDTGLRIYGAFLLSWVPVLCLSIFFFFSRIGWTPAPYAIVEECPDASEAQCPICLEGLGALRGRMRNCTHEFHEPCIVRWSRTSSACPVCRSDGAVRSL